MHHSVKSVESYNGFHVLNLDPEGFIVTADDDEIEPVIAFSDKGRFSTDPQNPLWVLLNHDLPARAKHLKRIKTNKSGSGATSSRQLLAGSDDPDEAHKRWQDWREKGKKAAISGMRSAISNHIAGGGGQGTSNPAVNPMSGITASALSNTGTPADSQTDAMPANELPAPEVKGISFEDGHAKLSHNAQESVRILVSYDAGQSWQTLDAGCFMSEWISKTPIREEGAWFKVEPDGIHDAMTVEFMRNPSPLPLAESEAPMPDETPTTSVGQASSVSDIRVSPLIASRWDQKTAKGYACYNYYCPPYAAGNANNYYSGCAATAMGQLMRFWQYPSTAYSHTYTYTQMPLTPATATYNLTQWQNIGRLLCDCGTSINMAYSSGGSSANMLLIDSALKANFSYTGAVDIYMTSGISAPQRDLILRSNLACGYPVLMGIRNAGGSGHAVVTDGFGFSSGTLYYHVNMGWSGNDDAWYNLPTVDDGRYNFTIVDAFVFNIYTSGTGELISGRVLSTAGVPIQGVTVTASRSGQNHTATTDSKGYYAIRVPSGQTYSVTASKAGYSSGTLSSVAVGTSQNVDQYYSGGQWGICRNYFGADFALSSFSISAIPLTDNVWLRWTAPTSCGFSDNTVYIRWSTTGYPATSSDGIEIYSGTSTVFEHTGLNGSGTITNYYTIWGNNGSPYADLGVNNHASGCPNPGQVKLFWFNSSTRYITYWLLNADGTRKGRGNVVGSAVGAGWDIKAAGDIDGDGTVDLIWLNSSTRFVTYWLLNADGTRKSRGNVCDSAVGAGWDIKAAGDIDGDGTVDLIWLNSSTRFVTYWLLNADGTRKSRGNVCDSAVGAGWDIKAAGDIDGDGTVDLIWLNSSTRFVTYWLLNADGTRKSRGNVCDSSVGAGWDIKAAGDIDGDGTVDLIWLNSSTRFVTYWLLNADGTRKSRGNVCDSAVGAGWDIKAAGDIDGDGTVDLIWLNSSTRFVTYWLLNADGTRKSRGNVCDSTVGAGWDIRHCGY